MNKNTVAQMTDEQIWQINDAANYLECLGSQDQAKAIRDLLSAVQADQQPAVPAQHDCLTVVELRYGSVKCGGLFHGKVIKCVKCESAAPVKVDTAVPADQTCRYPLCQSEAEQNRVAAEVHTALYSGVPADQGAIEPVAKLSDDIDDLIAAAQFLREVTHREAKIHSRIIAGIANRLLAASEEEHPQPVAKDAVLKALSVDATLTVPDHPFEAMTPKDAYEAGMMDGGLCVRNAIKSAVSDVLAAAPKVDAVPADQGAQELAPRDLEQRAIGRAEAVAFILTLSADDGLDDCVETDRDHSGEYSSHWNAEKLHAKFRTDDVVWSLKQEAEGEYWHNLGLREEAERLHAAAPSSQVTRNDVLEEIAQFLLNGRFLHDQAPTALFAREAAFAIRCLKTTAQPVQQAKETGK